MHSAHTVIPVILSGGAGTRLWPTSRETFPKQLLPLLSESSLFQETVWRVKEQQFASPIVVCSEEHRFLVTEQLRALGVVNPQVVLEPVGRNTAPAIVAAALLAIEEDPQALLLVLPSDHRVESTVDFRRAITRACEVAARGRLTTFGIEPDRVATGFGYIRRGDPIPAVSGGYAVERFVEKPDADTAERMLAEGGWLWNSGMFVLPANVMLKEAGRHEPEMLATVCEAVIHADREGECLRLGADAYARARAVSIDYALMEPTEHAAVVPAGFGWSDVGSWSALWEAGDRDVAGNVISGDVVSVDSTDSYLRGEDVLVAAVGLTDTVVVATADAVLVAARDKAQDVGALVRTLKTQGRREATSHRTVYRPWGCYVSVDAGPGYQVKHLTVKPGAQLSLQKHRHRAEHWVVIQGTAEVTRGQQQLVLEANMSIDIPRDCVHRLGNPSGELLHVIEVQTGSYLGEDDIIRLEDVYGRVHEHGAVLESDPALG